jgi:hypothetical protein
MLRKSRAMPPGRHRSGGRDLDDEAAYRVLLCNTSSRCKICGRRRAHPQPAILRPAVFGDEMLTM